jgi:hypothetical protein
MRRYSGDDLSSFVSARLGRGFPGILLLVPSRLLTWTSSLER